MITPTKPFNHLNFFVLHFLVHDSSAKLPSGVFQGNIHHYGDFDQCLDSVAGDGKFQGRYCLANVQVWVSDELPFLKTVKEEMVLIELFKSSLSDVSFSKFPFDQSIKFSMIFQIMFMVPRSSEFHWAFCVPSACSPQEVELSLTQILRKFLAETKIDFEVQVKDNQCHARDHNWIRNLNFSTMLVA